MTSTAVAVLLGVALLAALVALALVVARHRALRRRLEDRVEAALPPGARTPPGALDLADVVDHALMMLADQAEVACDGYERLGAALDALDVGVVIIDLRGAPPYRNAVADGFDQGRGADVLVTSTLDELFAQAVEGASVQRTLELFGPPARTMVLRALPLLDHDDPSVVVGALGLVEDVTDRQRLESVRRDFVANISHELRTPIGALGLLADAMADADDPDTAARLAERMASEVARVTRTIEDLLELSRIEGDSDRVTGDVEVAEVQQVAVERVQPVADAAGIDVVIVPAAEALVVRGDARQLVSALFNLLDNAVKYSDEGSTIELRSGRDGDVVELSVSDRGIGIPAVDLERVFERFYRVDAARSRTTGGTGLGLAIVRHVAANHGGDVTVRSRAGEGSTFTLRLPAADSAAPAAEVS